MGVVKFDVLPRLFHVVDRRVIVHVAAPRGKAAHVGLALGDKPDEHLASKHVPNAVAVGLRVKMRVLRVVGEVRTVAVEVALSAVDFAAAAPVKVFLCNLLDAVEGRAVVQETLLQPFSGGLVLGRQVRLHLLEPFQEKRVLDPVNLQAEVKVVIIDTENQLLATGHT